MPLNSPAPLSTYEGLVTTFLEFLTVAIHLVLYERDVYPRESFLSARKYDYPVQQNRHPKVCQWITDAVAAVGAEMMKCTVRQTSMVIYSPSSVPLERHVFSTNAFPIVRADDIHVPFDLGQSELKLQPNHSSDSRPTTPTPASNTRVLPSTIELTSQFAAVLSRLSARCAKLMPLPAGCSFTIAIELRDTPAGELPLDNQVTWIPAEPGLQPNPNAKSKGKERALEKPPVVAHDLPRQQRGKYLGGDRASTVRAVEAGPFVMEVWIEESRREQTSSHSEGEGTGSRPANEAPLASKPSRSRSGLQASVEDAGDEATSGR